MALLEAHHLSRTLTDEAVPVTIVKEASVAVEAGEFVAIKGPSGSGKSSLLYLLGLLDTPTSGDIWLDGQKVSDLSAQQLAQVRLEQMGFVFQFHFLLPEFTALENVTLPMRRLGKLSGRDITARGRQLLTDLGLAEHMDKLPSQLSGGSASALQLHGPLPITRV